MTPCQCTSPGHCERHKCNKNAHWLNLCQTRQDYFDLWETGKGPGQPIVDKNAPPEKLPPHKQYVGLGDVVAGAIKVATLGLVKPCEPCQKRKEALNKIKLWETKP